MPQYVSWKRYDISSNKGKTNDEQERIILATKYREENCIKLGTDCTNAYQTDLNHTCCLFCTWPSLKKYTDTWNMKEYCSEKSQRIIYLHVCALP